jgi:hypothetical protein
VVVTTSKIRLRLLTIPPPVLVTANFLGVSLTPAPGLAGELANAVAILLGSILL